MGDSELFSQALSILDHPSDPMVIHFQVAFTAQFREKGFAAADFRQATERLLGKHPRLRAALICEAAGFRMTSAGADGARALNEVAWSADGLGLTEFRQQAISFESAPLFRFRFRPDEGFFVACHHSLMDGIGCYEFALALMRELHPDGAPEPAPHPPARVPWHFRALRLAVMIADYLGLAREISRHPTSLLGPARPPERQSHHFLTATVEAARLRDARERLQARGVPATFNDLILTAFHLALGEAVSAKGPAGRVSTTVPVNRRPELGNPERFVNRMGYVCVSTLPAHRSGPEAALARIQAQMRRVKRFQTEAMVQTLMVFFERVGLLKLARKTWLKTKLPTRYTGPDAFFWKNLDTALVTNLGRIPAPRPYDEWISEMHGFVPVISPSVGLAVLGYGERIHFGLRFGSSVLDEVAGRRLLDSFTARLQF